jgi:hypothetical protein
MISNPLVITIYFQYIASILGFCFGTLSYLPLVWKREVKPNLSTWLVWGLAPISSFVVSIFAGTVGWKIFVVFMAGFGPMSIAITAIIRKQFYLDSKLIDIVAFILAISGIIIYFNTKNILLAIIILIMVDVAGSLPMLFKIWFSESENEPIRPFPIFFVVYSVGLFTQNNFTISSSLFLIYLIFYTLTLIISIYFKTLKLNKQNY